jgi:DNA repair protein RecO (recombination protein O)
VTAAAAGQYKHRLLKLPPFLSPEGREENSEADVADGLALTGFFLERHVLAPHHTPVPPARTRFVARFMAKDP